MPEPPTVAPPAPPDPLREELDEFSAWVERNPLRAWRLAQTPLLSQFAAARLFGVSVKTVGWWEAGVYRPQFDDRPQIGRHLGGDIERQWDLWLAEKPETSR